MTEHHEYDGSDAGQMRLLVDIARRLVFGPKLSDSHVRRLLRDSDTDRKQLFARIDELLARCPSEPPRSTPPPSTLRDPDPFGTPPSGDELEAAMKANDDDLTITLALRTAVRYSQAGNMEAATASAALALATAGLDSRCIVTVSARPEHAEPKRFDFKTEFAKFLEQHPMRARR